MENLKNTINKTETLKNNIKTIFTQIKQSIVRGGGSDFKSLAETPKQIENLLKQYSKVAILKDINADFREYENSDMPEVNAKVEIDLSKVDFEPKSYVFDFVGNWYYNQRLSTLYGDGNFITKDEVAMNHNGFNVNIKKENIKYDKKNKKLTLYGDCSVSNSYNNSTSLRVSNLVLLG